MIVPILAVATAAQVIAALLAFYVAVRSASAYSLTGRSHLLNFTAGFVCLGLSYLGTIAIAIAFYYPFPASELGAVLQSSDLLPRLVIELLGFALIASSYYTRDRAGSVLLLVLLVVATAGTFVFVGVYQIFASMPLAIGLRVLETALVVYTLVQISRSYTSQIVRGSIFVSWGFGMLTLSTYTWMIWAYDGSLATAGFGGALRIIGLLILVYNLMKK